MTLPLKYVRTAAVALVLAALAACAAPSPTAGPAQSAGADRASESAAPAAPADQAGAATQPPAATTPPPAKKYPRMTGGPLPPQRIDDAKAPPEVKVDASCRTDADCTVKNVGNCCGQYPACVNVNSPTDPKGVQARCAKSGMAAVCGFPQISSCSCVKGTCQAAGGQDVEETVR
jgi:hypothetical protein